MKNRTAAKTTATFPPAPPGERIYFPPAVIAASNAIDQLTDQQCRNALRHLAGAAPQGVIAAFAAVTGQ